MSEEARTPLVDEAVVLHVRNWQTADKYAVCFSREHGKLRFVAYGARYVKNVQGRLLQPFAQLRVELQQGQRIDKLRSCELLQLPQSLSMQQLAYAAVVAELTAVLTEDRAPQPELYELLLATLKAIREHNPRLVTLSFAIKLLQLSGFAPQLAQCVQCGRELALETPAWFGALQGGLLCEECHSSCHGDGFEPCSAEVRQLWQWLEQLDYEHPQPFKVFGGPMMQLERMLLQFIFFQTDKPLNSLTFLGQLGL